MVLSLIRGNADHGGFDPILRGSIAVLADARHSFELATATLLAPPGDDGSALSEDAAREVRDTDRRINKAEQRLRSDLAECAARLDGAEIETVIGLVLLLKKIERCGDHAKNILELAESLSLIHI